MAPGHLAGVTEPRLEPRAPVLSHQLLAALWASETGEYGALSWHVAPVTQDLLSSSTCPQSESQEQGGA